MARALPTTKAQVTGHKFLVRRVEHGLVFGDIRMIHDPLAKRSRALLIGIVAVVLVGLGAGLLAWLQPNPRPGEAPIVRSAQGQLFVLVDDSYHPVSNLSSARIIAGDTAPAAEIGDEHLAQSQLGFPLGIEDAPGFLAPEPGQPHTQWAACFAGTEDSPEVNSTSGISDEVIDEGEVIVLADPPQDLLGDTRGAVVEADDKQWLLSGEGRILLPEATSTQGRVLRRGLGVEEDTPVWPLPVELLNTIEELPQFSFPGEAPDIIDTGQGLWARSSDGVVEVTESQAEMLRGYGAKSTTADPKEVAALSDATANFHLPEQPLDFLSEVEGWLCGDSEGRPTLVAPQGGTVELSGDSVADRFGGLDEGGVGVDTGHGYHVVSATGQRHSVPDPLVLEALGTGIGAEAPWSIVRLLPEGSELARARALAAPSSDG